MEPQSEHAAQIAKETLERYSGSPAEEFQPYLLLTNFSQYVEQFARDRHLHIYEGAMFKAAHSREEEISILHFGIGSPAAALVADVCSFLPFEAALLLGMCGGLRSHYKEGEYFVPVASIRGEGTSNFYFPAEIPALANFLVQRAVTETIEHLAIPYHIGITYTMNKRFWEFHEEFRQQIVESRAQAIEMECATLFLASYRHLLPLGALLLISDLPLELSGIKTKERSAKIFEMHTAEHVDLGVKIIHRTRAMQHSRARGGTRADLEY